MPRYTHDPASVQASLSVLPKDEYEFVVGRPRAFERTASKGHQSYGVRFPLTTLDGKRSVFSIYLHSEGAAAMGKRFQIAASGYDVNEANEKRFDQESAGKDFSYDTDTGEVGEGWGEYEGVHVVCDVDVQPAKDASGAEQKDTQGNPIMQQVWGVWRPLEGAARDREAPAAVGA